MGFLAAILEKIGFDLLTKLFTQLSQLLSSYIVSEKQSKVNQDNADKEQQDIAKGASNEQVAQDAADLLNGAKH